MNNFKKMIIDMPAEDSSYGAYTEGLKRFYKDPIAAYKKSIDRKIKLIEKYQRLIRKHRLSIEWLDLLIKIEEEKENESP